MANTPFTPPKLNATAFHCPRCGAYAAQRWRGFHYEERGSFVQEENIKRSQCGHCGAVLIWSNKSIVVPDVSSAPPANDDLPDDIKADYNEAAGIAAKSPRGAAALLRLAIQKLCMSLGESGKDLNKDIAAL